MVTILLLILFCSVPVTVSAPDSYSVRLIAEPEPALSEWDRFVDALILIECEGDYSAVSSAGAAGPLQIMPIYVEDANRIIGWDRWTLDDRFSLAESMAMFEVMQDHYNPTRDILKAIKLHNPRAGRWYGDRILKRMSNE